MIDYKFTQAIGILHIPEQGFRSKMDQLFNPHIGENEKEERLEYLLWQKDASKNNHDFCFPDSHIENRDMADNAEIEFSGLCKKVALLSKSKWKDYVQSGATTPLDDLTRFKAKRFYKEILFNEATQAVDTLKPDDKKTYLQIKLEMMSIAEWTEVEKAMQYRKDLPEDAKRVPEIELLTLGLMIINNNYDGVRQIVKKYDQDTKAEIFNIFTEDWDLDSKTKTDILKALELKPTQITNHSSTPENNKK